MEQIERQKTGSYSGILLINKAKNKTSFSIVGALRRHLKVKKIGHAGTLDPFATGVMVMLIGREYTQLSDQFLTSEKEYIAHVCFGIETDTYDCDGQVVARSNIQPTLQEIQKALEKFQGNVEQIPPMFSAKKIQGKKMYELARKGIVIDRLPVLVNMNVMLVKYAYPIAEIHVNCSKGTYIRSIAYDMGRLLGCGAHLTALKRVRSGSFHIDNCIDGAILDLPSCNADILNEHIFQTKLSAIVA